MSARIHEPVPSTVAEDPDRYRAQGLHPIIIGDVLEQGRYRVIHKLGSASFATVWLGRDTIENKYVALKILSGDSPLETPELRILQDIKNSTILHPGRDYVLQIQNSFVINGPNGQHLCLVTPVAGERLARKPGLPHDALDWARAISFQIAQALGFIHTLGIAHGDCYTSNILFQLLPFDDWSEQDVYACLGKPVKHPVRRLDGRPTEATMPRYIVDPGNLGALEARLATDRILLIDFGSAFYSGTPPKQIFTPAPIAAPEILFGGEITSAVDQWAFGCTMYEIFADHSLVKLLFGWNNDAQKDQVSMLGKPPDTLWQNWIAKEDYFEPDGTPKEAQGRRLKVHPLSLKQRVRNLGKPISERGYEDDDTAPLSPDLESMYDLLKKIIVYDPGSRLPFERIQKHPFFQAVFQNA